MADYNLGPFRLRPRGEFDLGAEYRYLDFVTWNGSSYVNLNLDTIDGAACVGVIPEGAERSELYWLCFARKGDKGDMGDAYQNFVEVTDGKWDFSKSDKIFIPETGSSVVNITNVYSGCCGIILTPNYLTLPWNSDYAYDYNYVDKDVGQYFMYSFVYGQSITPTDRFVWHRTVINMGTGESPDE